MMPKMDGFTLYEKLLSKDIFKDIPFIFLTAVKNRQKQIEGLKKGALDYIIKPFSIEYLKYKIASILRIQELQKESNINNMMTKIASVIKAPINKDMNKIKIEKLFRDFNITESERLIIEKLLEGKSNKKIASEVFVSLATVKKHLVNIYRKFNIKSRMELKNIFTV